MPPDMANGWSEWSRHVLAELERLSSACETHNSALSKTREELLGRVGKIHTEIAMLKVKSGAWGAIGAGAVLLLGLVLWLIRSQVAGL